MDRAQIAFERAPLRPGELARGIILIELDRNMRAGLFEARMEVRERREIVISVASAGAPAIEERVVRSVPLLLELVHAPPGFGAERPGRIAMPRGFYCFGFAFRVPEEEGEVAVALRIVEPMREPIEARAVLRLAVSAEDGARMLHA